MSYNNFKREPIFVENKLLVEKLVTVAAVLSYANVGHAKYLIGVLWA